MFRKIALTIVALPLCVPAFANAGATPGAIPKLSGKYVLSFIDNCTATVTTTTVHENVVLADFDPVAGTISFSGFTLVVDPDTGPLMTGISGNFAFSNTKTSLTLNNVVYQAMYGSVKKGVATSLSYIGVSSPNCGAQGTLTRQGA